MPEHEYTISSPCEPDGSGELISREWECYSHKNIYIVLFSAVIFEPRCEKSGLRDFRPGPTKSGLYSHRRWLEA